MVSLNTALTLGVIGAAIAAFYGLGGASGIGSRIGSGLSSFGQSLQSSLCAFGGTITSLVRNDSRTALSRAAAPTPATTFPIVPLLNMFPILLVDLVEDLRFLMLLRGLVDLKGCDFRRLVVDLLRLLGVDLDDFRLFNATNFLVAAFCLALLFFLAKVFSIFRSTFRYSLS